MTAPSESETEVARLEQLLLERTRRERELDRELERRSALLRDACSRLSELAPRLPELQLQQERDAAVARAIEAEVARIEATFKLDEVLGQLLAAGPRPSPEAPSRGDRALGARVAELEEQKQVLEARLLLLEDQLGQEQAALAAARRERVESDERFELQLSQVRAWSAGAERELLELRDARSALLGERDGLRARLQDAESAYASVFERSSRASRLRAELAEKLEAEQAERAAQRAHVEAQALELERERTARSTLAAQLSAAEARAVPETDDARRRREAAQQARLEALRACLLELRVPLVELESSLVKISDVGSEHGAGAVDETTLPGMVMDSDVMTLLDEQLRAKQARIDELEATLRAAHQDEQAIRTAAQAEERERSAASRDLNVSTLKGELIDVRANAARLYDDLAKERSRRRKMGVTVRALQAAIESGEAPGPWIEELITLINEGASMPPKT